MTSTCLPSNVASIDILDNSTHNNMIHFRDGKSRALKKTLQGVALKVVAQEILVANIKDIRLLARG